MNSSNFNTLMGSVFSNPLPAKKPVKQMKDLASKNADDLAASKHKDFFRSPTSDELLEMRQWAIDYKRLHKQASKREIRKATQKHFNIQIFK